MGEVLHSITFLCCKHHYQNDSVQCDVLQKNNDYNNMMSPMSNNLSVTFPSCGIKRRKKKQQSSTFLSAFIRYYSILSIQCNNTYSSK